MVRMMTVLQLTLFLLPISQMTLHLKSASSALCPSPLALPWELLRDYKNFGFVEAGLQSWPILPQGHAIAAAAHTLMSTRRSATSSNFQRSNPTSTLRENVSFAWDCFCPHQNCAFSCVDNGPRRRLRSRSAAVGFSFCFDGCLIKTIGQPFPKYDNLRSSS